MGTLIFQYVFEWPHWHNEDGKRRMTGAFHEFLPTLGLRCYMFGLGGSKCSYGVVFRDGGNVTEEERQQVAEWIRAQPIRATIMLGDLEVECETTDINRLPTEWVFEVDNCR